MAKSKSNSSSLTNSRSRKKGQGASPPLPVTNLVTQSEGISSEKPVSLGRLVDTTRSSITGRVTPQGIRFGRPSSPGTKAASNSGSEWTNLLKQTASGGIASAFSGSFGGIGGLGSLVSGIFSLFGGGGKSTPPPLVEFQMPSSQQQTVYVGAGGSSTYQGSAVESIGGSAGKSGLYNTSAIAGTAETTPSSQWIQEQSGQIAQAVKTALLNSSSLNDVIAEL